MKINFNNSGFNSGGSGFNSNGGSGGSGFKSFFNNNKGMNSKKPKKPKKPRNTNGTKFFGKCFAYFVLFLFILVVSFFSGYCGGLLNDYFKKSQRSAYSDGGNSAFNGEVRVVDNSDVEALVEKVMPSMVGVVTFSRVVPKSVSSDGGIFGRFPFFGSPSFSYNPSEGLDVCLENSYQKNNMADSSNSTTSRVPKDSVMGVGSGFFIKNKGEKYVITNYHVIEAFVKDRAVDINAYNNGSNKHAGYGVYIVLNHNVSDLKRVKIVGYDSDLDIAVLKPVGLDVSKIPGLEFADMKTVKVGALALAFGNPFTLKETNVTRGIVSSFRKMRLENGFLRDVIYSDAALNHGSSGGPLIDKDGRVIGVNFGSLLPATSDASDRIEGISIATNGEIALAKINEMIQNGTMSGGWEHPSIGITVCDEGSLFSKFGVVIIGVINGTSADKAGLRPGDIIVSIDDVEVSNLGEWQREVRKKEVGEKVTLVVVRRGRLVKKEVVVGA